MIYDFTVRWKSMCNLVPASHLSGKYEVRIRYINTFAASSLNTQGR